MFISGNNPTTVRQSLPSSLPTSSEQSPCEIRALQEECRQLNLETRLSIDSNSSSGYHSAQFLRPPSPRGSRRCSESSVTTAGDMDTCLPSPSSPGCLQTKPKATSTLAMSEPGEMDAMYEDMYSSPSGDQGSRRFSYPNSPAHAG